MWTPLHFVFIDTDSCASSDTRGTTEYFGVLKKFQKSNEGVYSLYCLSNRRSLAATSKFRTPLSSIWFALSLTAGHFDDMVYQNPRSNLSAATPPTDGSMELLFLAGLWLLSLTACNAIVGIAIHRVKQVLTSGSHTKTIPLFALLCFSLIKCVCVRLFSEEDFKLRKMIGNNFDVEDSYIFFSDILNCWNMVS